MNCKNKHFTIKKKRKDKFPVLHMGMTREVAASFHLAVILKNMAKVTSQW